LPDEVANGLSLFEKLHQPFLLWWGNPEQQFLKRLLREDLERSIDALLIHSGRWSCSWTSRDSAMRRSPRRSESPSGRYGPGSRAGAA